MLSRQVDFGRTAADYVTYRRPFPPDLFARLLRFGIGRAQRHVLDIGAGTGLLGRELAKRGCRVVLTDVSPLLLARSSQLPGGQGAMHLCACAEQLPFADELFDNVTAGQCWHWLERRRAAAEIARVLRPGGWLAVIYQMYLPLPGNVAEASEKLILKYNPRWRHANSAGISGQVLRDMQLAGFTGIESFSFDVMHQYSQEEWRGLIRTTSAVGASLPPPVLTEFDRHHAVLLAQHPSLLQIPHRVFAAVAQKPAFAHTDHVGL